MHPWSQAVSLVMAGGALWAALAPRDFTRDMIGGADPFRLILWPKLLRFPIFWGGAAMLLLVLVQALNPTWRFHQYGNSWWLMSVNAVRWLPSSVSVPFERFNAWRQLIIYAGCWLACSAAWVGLTRRRSIRILIGVLVGNALLLCALLAFQRVTGDHRVPWPLIALTDKNLMASFIYTNHAGAYLDLMAFAAIALATWHLDHGRRALAKSTPAGVIALAALFIIGGVFFTMSRGATLVLAIALGIYGAWFLLRGRYGPKAPGSNAAVTKVVVLLLFFFVVVAFRYIDFSEIYGRWNSMLVERASEPDVHSRVLARHAAGEMLGDHWLMGVGAGGFRHLFPDYVRNYPEIYEGGTVFWEHAHCDWLEIPIELGLVGDLIILAGAGWWLSWFVRKRVLWHPMAVPLLIGCVQTLIHACFDFPFQCPAILATWCVLVTVAGRWADISET